MEREHFFYAPRHDYRLCSAVHFSMVWLPILRSYDFTASLNQHFLITLANCLTKVTPVTQRHAKVYFSTSPPMYSQTVL